LPKLEDFSREENAGIYEFSKAFYNTTAFDEEVERELERLEAEKKLEDEKSGLSGLKEARRVFDGQNGFCPGGTG
jgi:hypothetical protein